MTKQQLSASAALLILYGALLYALPVLTSIALAFIIAGWQVGQWIIKVSKQLFPEKE